MNEIERELLDSGYTEPEWERDVDGILHLYARDPQGGLVWVWRYFVA